MKNYRINIKGFVQGVGFRYTAKNMARSLGLSGFVKNLADESVYIEVEGEEENLKDFIRWCHTGPERARVEHVNVSEGKIQDFKGFETRF